MCIPAQTTRPPLRTDLNAAGTSAPTAAKMIAASSATGAGSSDPPALPRHCQRAVADQSGAEQRRGLDVAQAGRNRQTEACIGDRVRSIAAVARRAGKYGAVAKVFPV